MTRTRARLLGILLVACIPALALAEGEPPKKKLIVKFKADKMVLGSDLKTAVLTGHVKVTVSDVTITCKKLQLSYGKGKKVASFLARGKVKLVMGDLEATADRLEYDASTREALLEDNCQVQSKSVKLSGETIFIQLDTRKISIQKARGSIDIGNETF